MRKEKIEGGKAGFTLAETMIVLAVLGVIAVVTVPALVNKHIESTNRTKIKKAMTVYDTALNKMVIENGIKDNAALYENANSFAPEGNCTNTAPYFRVSTTLNNNICTFKASDGTYWDISKINAPIIAFNEADLNNANAENRFQLVGHFDNATGSLRVNDLQYETNMSNAEEKENLEKIYKFIDNKTSEEDGSESICGTSSVCKADLYKNTPCEDQSDAWSCTNCKKCAVIKGTGIGIFDENGNRIVYGYNCKNGENCNIYSFKEYNNKGKIDRDVSCYDIEEKNCYFEDLYAYNDAGQQTMYKNACNGKGTNCNLTRLWGYNDKGLLEIHKDWCNDDGQNCRDVSVYEYNEANQKTITKYGCNNDGQDCKSSAVYEYDENGNMNLIKMGCNAEGQDCEYYSSIGSGSGSGY